MLVSAPKIMGIMDKQAPEASYFRGVASPSYIESQNGDHVSPPIGCFALRAQSISDCMIGISCKFNISPLKCSFIFFFPLKCLDPNLVVLRTVMLAADLGDIVGDLSEVFPPKTVKAARSRSGFLKRSSRVVPTVFLGDSKV